MNKAAGVFQKIRTLFKDTKAVRNPAISKGVKSTASKMLRNSPIGARRATVERHIAKIETEYKKTKNKAKYLDDMNALERGIQADKAKGASKINVNKATNVAAGLGAVGLGMYGISESNKAKDRKKLIGRLQEFQNSRQRMINP